MNPIVFHCILASRFLCANFREFNKSLHICFAYFPSGCLQYFFQSILICNFALYCTMMSAGNVSPALANISETYSTLRYASQARKIVSISFFRTYKNTKFKHYWNLNGILDPFFKYKDTDFMILNWAVDKSISSGFLTTIDLPLKSICTI